MGDVAHAVSASALVAAVQARSADILGKLEYVWEGWVGWQPA
jgi:hypothetical protein